MKTMMKITRKSYEIAIALAIALAGLMARDAGAALYNGYYTGDYGRDDNARVYISTFEEETYGVVMQINRKGTRVSLFNIEEQEDGTTQWTPMFQSNAHVITSGEAMYIGRYERSSVLKRRMLILNPTRSAYDAGIKEEVSVRRRNLKGYSRVWKQLPAQGFRIERTKNANGFVTIPTVKIPRSFAISATTGAAPVPVPPPMPAVTKIISASLMASVISARFSSAACLPRSGFIPVPIPLVRFLPIYIRFFACV